LTWHFAIAFANASIDDVFGPYAFAQVWLEFVKRLRTYYDSTKDFTVIHYSMFQLRRYDLRKELSSFSIHTRRRMKYMIQDRSPMTEDMVDEYANYLSSLDDGEARVQAQLDVLRSDMQAFKAANPKCCLEDFIRWHSPKDWIEEEECLSERMQLPDNTWVRCWSEAMPIPVVNQARLFNESKIAEEILSLLENATVQQMVELIRPVLFVAAVVQMIQKGNILSISLF
uniref:Rab3 GTPase-activating protein catalytic subunit n=1 Tax=Haemonchus placei TaxID=6290 RepID=A0A0N4WUH0_HAEPC